MSDGSNAANGMPGYKKAVSGGYYTELFTAAAPAPPDAGLPWKVGDSSDNPLSDDPPNTAPPQPDRHIRDLSQCPTCGATFGFATDAAQCANCTDAARITGGLTTPGTPWF